VRRISFETAKLAAEKGYDEDCDSAYDIHGNIIYIDNYVLGIIPEYCCPAPYQEELQEWLREEKGIHICIDVPYVDKEEDPYPGYYYQLYYTSRGTALSCQRKDNQRSSYEETLEIALTDALNKI
jgi:hypothetical protein